MTKRKRSALSRDTPKSPSPKRVPVRQKKRLPSPPMTRILRRKGTPTCCTFGRNRKAIYPNYFFCANCTQWDNEILRVRKTTISTRPNRLRCLASHSSFIFPTDKLEGLNDVISSATWPCKKNKKTAAVTPSMDDMIAVTPSTDDMMDPIAESNTPDDVMDPIEVIERESILRLLVQKDQEIEHLKKQLENSKKLVFFYCCTCNSEVPKNNGTTNEADEDLGPASALNEVVLAAVNKAVSSDNRFVRYGKVRKGRLVAKAVFNPDFALGSCLPYIIDKAKLWLKNNVYTPWKILKAMDIAGGSLNYTELEVLRQVETQGKKYYRGSVLPCTADIKRAATKLEPKADVLVPFKEYQSPWGKGIKFCEARALRVVCKSFGVLEKAKEREVSVSESIDAAEITKNMSLITAGFKTADVDAVDPISKKPLCIGGLYNNMQFRNNVFPLQLIVAKETKDSYEAFKGFFDFLPWQEVSQ
jgi:hypothetical protein